MDKALILCLVCAFACFVFGLFEKLNTIIELLEKLV